MARKAGHGQKKRKHSVTSVASAKSGEVVVMPWYMTTTVVRGKTGKILKSRRGGRARHTFVPGLGTKSEQRAIENRRRKVGAYTVFKR